MPANAVHSSDMEDVHQVPELDWTSMRVHVRAWQKHAAQHGGTSVHSFCMHRFDSQSLTRLYALGPPSDACKEHTLLYVDIPDSVAQAVDTASGAASCSMVWRPLLSQQPVTPTAPLSLQAALQRERQRLTTHGITAYDRCAATNTFVFISGSALFRVRDEDASQSCLPEMLPLSHPSRSLQPLDPKLCPSAPHLIAFVSHGDVWLSQDDACHRLTHTSECKDRLLFAGMPSYIIEEEFDRYTGFWWQPTAAADSRLILYEETDETDVSELAICCPSVHTFVYRSMKKSLHELFPWHEYLVRAGWTADGCAVWAELLSRKQERLSLILIPLSFFTVDKCVARVNVADSMEDLATAADATEVTSSADVTTTCSNTHHSPSMQLAAALRHDDLDAAVYVLHTEEVTDLYLQVTDHTYSLRREPHEDRKRVKFIWSSQKSGYHHLYRLETMLTGHPCAGCDNVVQCEHNTQLTQLTTGQWEVPALGDWVVDEANARLFFAAVKDSPIEPHIYTTNYDSAISSLHRLTPLGRSYWGRRSNHSTAVCGNLLVAVGSSLYSPPECHVFALRHAASNAHQLATVVSAAATAESDAAQLSPAMEVSIEAEFAHQSEGQLPFGVAQPLENAAAAKPCVEPPYGPDRTARAMEPPQIISYRSANSGYTHYAILFKPVNWKAGVKYPCVLSTYAGPCVQLVRNGWMGRHGAEKLCALGYAVVSVDGRGSAYRGLAFESQIRNRMGTIEIDDQVEGLRMVAARTGVIDLSRVAIRGWSYGGYSAIVALARYPEIFRVAIAGAPVTCWLLYDTGYTERYLGLPLENAEVYRNCSPLSMVHQLPCEPGRLLLLHGLIDENVHFAHTAQLIAAMSRLGIPYDLQIFPSERHALRSPTLCEHLETTVLMYLQRNMPVKLQ